ncbi:DUF1223 domain-containing protein [Paraburkholderia sp. J41]|uniref:DUF1223 domain-containing protein n=1 Tax=Paraburkholderia sp. J41 TaxID=2805433 RepID=UPI002AC31752|nr:DUF1223 domain-containing protein [Paraburkholderia sp. J41]
MLARSLAVALLLPLFFAAPAAARARPVVVELFTSEGCSSCPPADAYLSELAHDGPEVFPLAFHVTYWDSLGWKDPWSLEAATQRQAAYAARFREFSYTPEMVIDGRQALVGSDRRAVGAAIAAARDADRTHVEVSGARAGTTLSVKVGAGAGRGTVLLIGYDPGHVTKVGRGENAGRALGESNIVRSIEPIGEWRGAPLTLESTLPAGERAAVLIQSPDGAIVGAARVDDGAR